MIAAAALPGVLTASEVLFTVRVLRADDPRLRGIAVPVEAAGEAASALQPPLQKYVIDFAVDPNGLDLTAEAGGKRRAQLEFLAMDYDRGGRRLNYSDRGYAFVLTPEQYHSALNGGIPCRLVLDVPKGDTTLRLAVHDLLADRIGSLEVPLK